MISKALHGEPETGETIDPNNPADCIEETTFLVTVRARKDKPSRVSVATRGHSNKIMWFSRRRYADRNSLQLHIKDVLCKSIAKVLQRDIIPDEK